LEPYQYISLLEYTRYVGLSLVQNFFHDRFVAKISTFIYKKIFAHEQSFVVYQSPSLITDSIGSFVFYKIEFIKDEVFLFFGKLYSIFFNVF
jgi:hypothetical protein